MTTIHISNAVIAFLLFCFVFSLLSLVFIKLPEAGAIMGMILAILSYYASLETPGYRVLLYVSIFIFCLGLSGAFYKAYRKNKNPDYKPIGENFLNGIQQVGTGLIYIKAADYKFRGLFFSCTVALIVTVAILLMLVDGFKENGVIKCAVVEYISGKIDCKF